MVKINIKKIFNDVKKGVTNIGASVVAGVTKFGASASNLLNQAAAEARKERDKEKQIFADLKKTHSLTDPIKLKNTKDNINKQYDNSNNYIKYSTGSKFQGHFDAKNQYFNNQNEPIQNLLKLLLTKQTTDISGLIQQVDMENKILKNQIKENILNENHSKKVKSEFQKKEIERLTSQNVIIWYAFYVLVLVLAVVMWYFNSVNMVLQIIIFIILIVYPFFIYYFELFLYIIFSYLKSFFESTPYNKVYLGYY